MDEYKFKKFVDFAKLSDVPINKYWKPIEESKLSLMLCADMSNRRIMIKDEQTNQVIVIADACETDASYLYFCTKHSLRGEIDFPNSVESYNHRLKYHMSNITGNKLQSVVVFDTKYNIKYELVNLSFDDLRCLSHANRFFAELLSRFYHDDKNKYNYEKK